MRGGQSGKNVNRRRSRVARENRGSRVGRRIEEKLWKMRVGEVGGVREVMGNQEGKEGEVGLIERK